MMIRAEKRAISSSVSCNSLNLSAKSNIELSRKPQPVFCTNSTIIIIITTTTTTTTEASNQRNHVV